MKTHYRYQYLCPHASCADVSEWLQKHTKGPEGLAVKIRDGVMLPIALLDHEDDVRSLRESFDVVEVRDVLE